MWVSPSLIALLPLLLVMLGSTVPGMIQGPFVVVRVIAAACALGIIGLCRAFARNWVLVLRDGRLWWKGRWYDRDTVSRVVPSAVPWEIVDLPSVVIETQSGKVIDPGLWRFRQSAADALGEDIAAALGVPFI